MKNSVKEDWKRRLKADVFAVVAVPLLLYGSWQVIRFIGRPFGDILQLDSNQVASVRIIGNANVEISDQQDMAAIVRHVKNFRYAEVVRGVQPEMLAGLSFFDASDSCLCSLGLGRSAVLWEDTLYMGATEHFSELIDLPPSSRG